MNFIDWLAEYGMDIKSIVEIVISALGIIFSLVAVNHSRKAILLTEKSVYESNRPVVSIYIDYISVSSTVHEYLVIKNFGATPAKIINLEFSLDMPVTHVDSTNLFSEYGMPFSLAPNQSFATLLRSNALATTQNGVLDIYHGEFTATVTYTDTIKTFSESFLVNQDLVKNLRTSKSNGSKSDTVNKTLLHVSEELLRKSI